MVNVKADMVKSLVQFHTSLPRDQIQPLLDRLASINEHLNGFTDLEVQGPESGAPAATDASPEAGTGDKGSAEK